METLPENLEYVGEVMSNFDHSIDRAIEAELMKGNTFGSYPAWNFHAIVWFDSKFKAMISRYHILIDTIEASDLDEIMAIASDKWGNK